MFYHKKRLTNELSYYNSEFDEIGSKHSIMQQAFPHAASGQGKQAQKQKEESGIAQNPDRLAGLDAEKKAALQELEGLMEIRRGIEENKASKEFYDRLKNRFGLTDINSAERKKDALDRIDAEIKVQQELVGTYARGSVDYMIAELNVKGAYAQAEASRKSADAQTLSKDEKVVFDFMRDRGIYTSSDLVAVSAVATAQGNTEFQESLKTVQASLKKEGYYHGPIDGTAEAGKSTADGFERIYDDNAVAAEAYWNKLDRADAAKATKAIETEGIKAKETPAQEAPLEKDGNHR